MLAIRGSMSWFLIKSVPIPVTSCFLWVKAAIAYAKFNARFRWDRSGTLGNSLGLNYLSPMSVAAEMLFPFLQI